MSKMIRAGSGLKYSVPLMWFDRDTSCWRTYQACLFEGWESYRRAWPRSAMQVNGRVYLRRRLVRTTNEIASGLFATPTAADAKGSHGGNQNRSLRTDIAEWKRTGRDPKGIEKQKRAKWPTPCATDALNMPARRKAKVAQGEKDAPDVPTPSHALALSAAVRIWPTPTARDVKDRGSVAQVARHADTHQVTLGRAVSKEVLQEDSAAIGRLNPLWVAWLMGYPARYLNLPFER